MLKVTLTKTKTQYKLEMTGHCATAPKGYDLVCAAASILCLTMAQVLEENEDKLKTAPKINIAEGDAKMVWKPQQKYEGALNNSLYTVTTGLRVLQHNHPDCIEFIKK